MSRVLGSARLVIRPDLLVDKGSFFPDIVDSPDEFIGANSQVPIIVFQVLDSLILVTQALV